MKINNFSTYSSSDYPGMNKVLNQNQEKTPQSKQNTSMEFILKPDIDTYQSSLLEECDSLVGSNKAMLESWEAANQKYGDDSFKLYSGAQHLAFGQKLHEIGFFEGMFEEEVSHFEGLLKDLTEVMSSVNMNGLFNETSGSGLFSYFYQGEFVTQKYDEALLHTYSDDAKMELESATAALQYFSEKYLDKDQKEEFDSLVKDFYAHNTEYLADYQDHQERMTNFSQMMYASGRADRFLNWSASQNHEEYSKHMGSIKHTEEEHEAYTKNVAAIFKKLQQTGVNSPDLWKQLKENHLNYLTKDTERQDFKDRVWEQSESVFNHMNSYWSKLLEN